MIVLLHPQLQGFTDEREIVIILGLFKKYNYWKMELISIVFFIKGFETKIFLSSYKKNAQSLIRVQRSSCVMYIMALNMYDGIIVSQ